MIQTTIQTAQETLPQLLEQALNGEEVVIERDGKALARIVPVEVEPPEGYNPNWVGMDEGKIWIAPDFNETPEEFIEAIDGKDE